MKALKKILPEIIWIVILAGLFGFLKNIFAVNPLPLIPKTAEELAVPDSVLSVNEDESASSFMEKIVTYEQIVKLIDKPDVIFIDARNPEAYIEGHIKGAENIFPFMDDQSEYLMKINMLPQNKIFILYCDGGSCDLSHQLAKDLFEFGYKQSFIYQGGWEEWIVKREE